MRGPHRHRGERRGADLAAVLRHLEVLAEERLRGGGAQAHDGARADDRELGVEPGAAGADLAGVRLLVDALLAPRLPLEVLHGVDKLTRQATIEVSRETNKIFDRYGDRMTKPILHSSVKKTGNDLIWRWIFERINDEGK